MNNALVHPEHWIADGDNANLLWAYPYVLGPFLKEFTPRLQERGLHGIWLHGRIDEGCCDIDQSQPQPVNLLFRIVGVSDHKAQAAPETRNQPYTWARDAAHFQLSALPGCGGILVSHNSLVQEKHRRQGYGLLLQEMKERFARLLGVGKLLATVIEGNEPEEHLLRKTGWVAASPAFTSRRTGSRIIQWEKLLK